MKKLTCSSQAWKKKGEKTSLQMTHICFSDQTICKNICLLPNMTFDFKPTKIQNREGKNLVFSVTWKMTNFLLFWQMLSTFVFTLFKIQTWSEKIFSLKKQQDQQIQNFIFLTLLWLIFPQIHPAPICQAIFMFICFFSASGFFYGAPGI